MSVHHLNCASFRPIRTAPMVTHCLLVERPDGLLLVDSGFGTADLAAPRKLGLVTGLVLRPTLDPGEPAVVQVRAMGFDPREVTDVVLTHLDLDHVGGISDFPDARIHVFGTELDAAVKPHLKERARYLPHQREHGPQWMRHDAQGDDWFGFGAVTALGDDVVLVPTPGHSRGHCAVAVRRADGHWLLHAGDSYFHGAEKTDAARARAPATLRLFQRMLAYDDGSRRENAERIRELHAAHADEVTVFSAHDPGEFAALAGSAD